MKVAMAYYYSPARACYLLLLLLLLQPLYGLWFMAPHTAALSSTYDFSNPGDLHRANLRYLGDSTTDGNSTTGNSTTDDNSTTDNSTTGNSTEPSKLQLWVVILIAGASLSFVALVVALLRVMRRQRPLGAPMEIALQVARKFSYRELSTATNNFSKDRKLGAGQFGEVYRGELPGRLMPPVAVKRLTRQTEERTRKDYVRLRLATGEASPRETSPPRGWG